MSGDPLLFPAALRQRGKAGAKQNAKDKFSYALDHVFVFLKQKKHSAILD